MTYTILLLCDHELHELATALVAGENSSELACEVEADVFEVLLGHLQDVA